MPNIHIEPSTLERLKSHAIPFVDTEDSVINRGLDALETLGTNSVPIDDDQVNERIMNPQSLSSLTHTTVLSAMIDGKPLPKPNWNKTRNDMLRRGMEHFGNFDRLSQACRINMVQGKKEHKSYSYMPDIDISVQYQGANEACLGIITLAKILSITLEIAFYWLPKDRAAYPGQTGRLVIGK